MDMFCNSLIFVIINGKHFQEDQDKEHEDFSLYEEIFIELLKMQIQNVSKVSRDVSLNFIRWNLSC